MAAVTRTEVVGSGHLFTWNLTTADPIGDAVQVPAAAEKCVVLAASTAGAATAKMQGSNDGTNYLSLTDPQGNELSKTASGLEQILEAPVMVRPNLTTVGAGAIWIVQLYVAPRR